MLEFPLDISLHEMGQAILSLLKQGYKVTIAHVERYREALANPLKLAALKKAGVLIQVNADTVIKGRMSEKRFLDTLIKNDLLGAIASDAHDMDYRPVNMAKAFKKIEKKYGRDIADKLFSTNIAIKSLPLGQIIFVPFK